MSGIAKSAQRLLNLLDRLDVGLLTGFATWALGSADRAELRAATEDLRRRLAGIGQPSQAADVSETIPCPPPDFSVTEDEPS
jgi:hypothetical protein